MFQRERGGYSSHLTQAHLLVLNFFNKMHGLQISIRNMYIKLIDPSYKLGLNNIVKSNWLNSKSKFRAIQNSVEMEPYFDW